MENLPQENEKKIKMKKNRESGFISHLTELRSRIINSFIFLLIFKSIFSKRLNASLLYSFKGSF